MAKNSMHTSKVSENVEETRLTRRELLGKVGVAAGALTFGVLVSEKAVRAAAPFAGSSVPATNDPAQASFVYTITGRSLETPGMSEVTVNVRNGSGKPVQGVAVMTNRAKLHTSANGDAKFTCPTAETFQRISVKAGVVNAISAVPTMSSSFTTDRLHSVVVQPAFSGNLLNISADREFNSVVTQLDQQADGLHTITMAHRIAY